MCGLFGAVSSDLTFNDFKLFQILGALSVLRGTDSAGVAVVTKSKKGEFKPWICKDAVPSAALVYDKGFLKAVNDDKKGTLCTLMGHARYATVGNINKVTAHPFQVENVIAAHNGTIDKFVDKKPGKTWKWDGIAHEWALGDGMVPSDPDRTDSLVLTEKIAKNGLEETVREINDVDGAAAITWLDMEKGTFNIWRNDKRPLYLARSVSGNTVFWCSEEELFILAKSRQTQTATNPFMVSVNSHYEFNFGEPGGDFTVTKVAPPEKVYPIVQQWKPQGGNNDRWPFHSRTSTDRNNQTLYEFMDAHQKSLPPIGIGDPVGTVIGGNGNVVSLNTVIERKLDVYWTGWYPMNPLDEDGANAALSVGCKCCHEVSSLWETTTWISPREYYCEECISNPQVDFAIEQGGIKTIESEFAY